MSRELLLKTYLDSYDEMKRVAFLLTKKSENADDLLQNAYINIHLYDKHDEINQPKAFVKKIILNLFYNQNRSDGARDRLLAKLDDAATLRQEAEDSAQDEDRLSLIADFANTLPKKQRQVLIQILKGIELFAIAKKQKNKYNTIKHNRRIVVEKLREFFKQRGEEFNYGI